MIFQSKTILCSACATTFTFGAEEQKFFAFKGFNSDPKRCPPCRQARKSGHYIINCYSSPGQILGGAQARLASLLI